MCRPKSGVVKQFELHVISIERRETDHNGNRIATSEFIPSGKVFLGLLSCSWRGSLVGRVLVSVQETLGSHSSMVYAGHSGTHLNHPNTEEEVESQKTKIIIS